MKYHNISKDDFLNGDGIRAVLFVSGCTHHCPECHNPITWNKDGGLDFDADAKAELFEYLKNDYVSGITFSGGDPLAMYNREEVLALMAEVKEAFPNKTIWVYTGWTKDELKEQGFFDRMTPYVDVLVEGKFEIAKRSVPYHWAGSTNQRVLRKESNFEINTSDPIYEVMIEMEEKIGLLGNPEVLKKCEDLIAKTSRLLNPDGYIKENVEELVEIFKNAQPSVVSSLNDSVAKNIVKEKLSTAISLATERILELSKDVDQEQSITDKNAECERDDI